MAKSNPKSMTVKAPIDNDLTIEFTPESDNGYEFYITSEMNIYEAENSSVTVSMEPGKNKWFVSCADTSYYRSSYTGDSDEYKVATVQDACKVAAKWVCEYFHTPDVKGMAKIFFDYLAQVSGE